MAKSSRRRRNKRGLVAAALIVLLILVCLGLLIVAGYNVDATLAAYSVIITVLATGLFMKLISTMKVLETELRDNINLMNENKLLDRQNKSLRGEYDVLVEELEVSKQKRGIADRSIKIYKIKWQIFEEILEKLIKENPELEAEVEAYRARICENQEAAKETHIQICECISRYKASAQREDIEEACELYLSLSSDKRKWLPAKKKLKNKIIECVQQIKRNMEDETVQ